MRKIWLSVAAAILLSVTTIPSGAHARTSDNSATQVSVPPSGKGKADEKPNKSDNLKTPFQIKQDQLRKKGLQAKLAGKAPGKVHEVAKGQFVELVREATDRIFVVIAEFGNIRHPSFPDSFGGVPASDALEFDGPLHNNIPQPDRAVDNSTLWQEDYNEAHYEDMYFNRMAEYYERQSSGRYSVVGDVTAWVKVPFNEARYGRDICGSIVCNNTWFLIRDAMSFWVQGQMAAGKTVAADHGLPEDVRSVGSLRLRRRRQLHRARWLHRPLPDRPRRRRPGSGRSAAGHRRYLEPPLVRGSSGGGPHGFPGVQRWLGRRLGVPVTVIPNNPTGVWVGDYTIQPENGGLGVFAHEFAHDLGLPDLYDTSGNTGGAENSTGFWTLMSSGANIGDGGPDGIGDAPTIRRMGEVPARVARLRTCPGGIFYEVARVGQKSEHKLGRERASDHKEGSGRVRRPAPRSQETTIVDAPKTGTSFLEHDGRPVWTRTMTKSLRSRAGAAHSPQTSGMTMEDFGLRVPRGLHQRRRDLDAGRMTNLSDARIRRPERLQLAAPGSPEQAAGYTCRSTGPLPAAGRCRAPRSGTGPIRS